MRKIPTIFKRVGNLVINEPIPGCEWVFRGEGIPTEKLDGTNIRLTIRNRTVVRVEKRRNPTKDQKGKGILDPWYIDAHKEDPNDRYIFEAVNNTDTSWAAGEHCCEAIGPKIQGNPLRLDKHICFPFDLCPLQYVSVQIDFEGLKKCLLELPSLYSPGYIAEGIVFHHPDGRRAKIKRTDFYR